MRWSTAAITASEIAELPAAEQKQNNGEHDEPVK
jgi:hypothetical protein